MGGRGLAKLVVLAGIVLTPAAGDIGAEGWGNRGNDSLVWGPFRPNLYFGVRPRVPGTILSSVMWARLETFEDVQNQFRHTCEQHQGMDGYGWDEYDARSGGRQTIRDAANQLDLTTSFVKFPGGQHGGSWAVRVRGEPHTDSAAVTPLKSTVLFAISQDGVGSTLEVANAMNKDGDSSSNRLGFDTDVTLVGNSVAFDEYKVVITKGSGKHPAPEDHPYQAKRDVSKTVVQSFTAQSEHLWQERALIFHRFKDGLDGIVEAFGETNAPSPHLAFQLANQPGSGNFHVVQKIFEGPFEFDILFSSGSAGKELTSEDVDREIAATSKEFKERFPSIFPLQKPYDTDEYQQFARSMFSNLLGGIGYFHGNQLVDRSYAPEYDEENEGFWEESAIARSRHKEDFEGPYELFTSIPSRPFFPRGFLWDEGFHLLPIADWDIDLTLDVVQSWFNLMDEDGWIGREQILGPEARSKVPTEFQVQYPHYANPPTLFLVIEDFVDKLARAKNGSVPIQQYYNKLGNPGERRASTLLDNPEAGLKVLRELYPLLKRQFEWFRRTQWGDIKSYDRECFSKKEAYRWRGRTIDHILTSGLDDYPRPQPPHPGELHVDLLSWVGLMARVLAKTAVATGLADDEAEPLLRIVTAIERNAVDLHWSHEAGCFCDASVDDFDEHRLVCHKGYVSLFPFLTGLVPAHNHDLIGRLLDLMSDDTELWSKHGLRSLSRKNEFYGTHENYWRSPVWININYMALVQLQNLGNTPTSPHAKRARALFDSLRINIVDTIYASWKATGFAWEQYNPDTGAGQRTQHFTGWTSLVVKIMTMEPFGEDSSTTPPKTGAGNAKIKSPATKVSKETSSEMKIPDKNPTEVSNSDDQLPKVKQSSRAEKPKEEIPIKEKPSTEMPKEEISFNEKPNVEMPKEEISFNEKPNVEMPKEEKPKTGNVEKEAPKKAKSKVEKLMKEKDEL